MIKKITAEAIIEIPKIDLSIIERGGKPLLFHRFGSRTYEGNISKMQQTKYRSAEFPEIAFSPATTSQSIDLAAEDPNKTKLEVLDPRWLQLGPYVRASKGVFLNPPRDREGNLIIDESALEQFLHDNQLADGIYLVPNQILLY